VFKAHRLLYHSTLGLRVIKKKKKKQLLPGSQGHNLTLTVVYLPYSLDSGRGGLVFKAHRPVFHSTIGLRVIKTKQKKEGVKEAPLIGYQIMTVPVFHRLI